MSYPCLSLCGIPWLPEPKRIKTQSYLKRIKKAQLKLVSTQNKLIGLEFVPIIRSKRLPIKNKHHLQIKEIKRQENLEAALIWVNERMKAKRPLKQSDLLKMHSLISNSKRSTFRKEFIYLKDFKGNKLANFPHPQHLSELMTEFWTWTNKMGRLSALIRAIGAHFLLANIHPFQDGNGRIARLFEYYEIARKSPKSSAYFSFEFIHYWSFNEYSHAIQTSLKTCSMAPFIDYCLEQQTLFLEDLVRKNYRSSRCVRKTKKSPMTSASMAT